MANVIGIDVSKHNGTLDWGKIKAAGIGFAILRAGYGKNTVDSQFHANAKGAIAQGIPIGVYWFSYALNAEMARAEAKACCKLLKGYQITLPVFYDFEYDTVEYAKKQGVTLGKEQFNDFTVAFCEEVKAQGYTPGTYYNLDYKRRFVDAARLKNYVQWYAQYASKPSWSGYDLWQYASTYRINGCNCNFDVNLLANTALLNGGGQTEPKKEEPEMTKAEIEANVDQRVKTQVAAKLATLTDLTGTGDKPSDWAEEVTAWAKSNGIFEGDGSGNYGWQKAVTREQLAAVMMRMLELFQQAMADAAEQS